MDPYIHPRVHIEHHMAQRQAEASRRRLAASLPRTGARERGQAVRVSLVGAVATALLATILAAGAVEAPRSSASTSRISAAHATPTDQAIVGRDLRRIR